MRRAAILLAPLALAGCNPPRSESYFRAHVDEAAQVMVACEAGAHRGAECGNAEAATAQAQGAARLAQYKKGF